MIGFRSEIFKDPKFSSGDVQEKANEVVKDISDRASQLFLKEFQDGLKQLNDDSLKSGNRIDPMIELMRFSFRSLNQLNSHMNKDDLRRKLLDEILLKKDSLPKAIQILTNNNFAKKSFGEDQAVARIYSIALLRHAADRGDRLPLQKATRDLAKTLKLKKNPRPGEWRDFEDLIENLIKTDTKYVIENIDQFLSDLAYSKEVGASFSKAIYFGLQEILPKAELEKFIDDSTTKYEIENG